MTSHGDNERTSQKDHDDGVSADGHAPSSEMPVLRGSLFVAERMERRKFIRRASTSLFAGFVAVSSGTASLVGFLASPAAAAGGCCPSCCGPSPCCNTTCCNKGCCSPVGQNSVCSNNGVTCFGYDNTWSGTHCWACVNGGTITTCCDCITNSQTNCANPAGNRCICYSVGDGPAPKGVRIIRDASQVPAGN